MGVQSPVVADLLIKLATASLSLGDRSAAQAHAERVISIHEGGSAPKSVAKARLVLADAIWREEPVRAVALAEQARASLTGSTSGATLDKIEAWLAEHRAP